MRYLVALFVIVVSVVALPITPEGEGQLAAAESLEARAQAMAQIRMFKVAAMKQAASKQREREKVHYMHTSFSWLR